MAYDPVVSVAPAAQTASIGSTTLFTASATGLYQLSYYLVTTTAGSAGTVLATFGWNDGAAGRTLVTTTIVLSALTGFLGGVATIYLAAGQVVTYATTVAAAVGSPQYTIAIALRKL